MDEKKQITLVDLAQMLENLTQEMRVGFKVAREYSQQGFEVMNAKIDTVESGMYEQIDGVKSSLNEKIDLLRADMFTPDEKASILDTVKLVNDHLADNVTGKDNITFTRKEYDVVTEKVGLPNKFFAGGLSTQTA